MSGVLTNLSSMYSIILVNEIILRQAGGGRTAHGVSKNVRAVREIDDIHYKMCHCISPVNHCQSSFKGPADCETMEQLGSRWSNNVFVCGVHQSQIYRIEDI